MNHPSTLRHSKSHRAAKRRSLERMAERINQEFLRESRELWLRPDCDLPLPDSGELLASVKVDMQTGPRPPNPLKPGDLGVLRSSP